MLLTSGYNFDGYEIVSYLGHESAQVVLGTGIFSSFDASISDFLGTRSNTYESKLDSAEKVGKERLIEKAKRNGGNAIIGIDVDYTTFSNDIIGVIVGGTVVKIEKKMPEKETKRIPNMEYNTSIPIKVLDTIIVYKTSTDKFYLSIYGKNYSEEIIKGLEVKINIVTIFNNVIEISDTIFADIQIDDKNEFITEYSSTQLDVNIFKAIKSVSVRIVKYITNDNNVVDVSEIQNEKLDITQEQLMDIRKFYGNDTVCKAHKIDSGWVCYCGMKNSDNEHTCQFCGREVKTEILHTMPSDGSVDAFDLSEHMEIINSMKNSREIYDYLQKINCSDTYFNSVILPEIKKYVDCERMYGSMKNSAISKLKELCL